MKAVFKNCIKYENGKFSDSDFSEVQLQGGQGNDFKIENCYIFPAFCDVHVHLREPGFFLKETIFSGSSAAARGGYSDVFAMPNLNPVPDCVEAINLQREIIKNTAVINVHPYASITIGQKGEELADFEGLAELCCAFSDDGRGVQSEKLMLKAMKKAKVLDKIIVAHCENNSLLRGGYIHDGEYARAHGHKGICSESEWEPISRDLKLAEQVGCKYHVCHISTKESVQLIREAKRRGVDVTCETAPHYLVMNDSMLQEDGRFKMNPPIRSEEDRLALIEGIKDGTIDVIATDHAPHTAKEKSKGLAGSLMGVVGIETSFAVLYTKLVKTGAITLEKLIELMAINPRKRFGLDLTDDFCVFDLESEYVINPDDFLSKGRSTPFAGNSVYGKCELTVCGGKAVWISKN